MLARDSDDASTCVSGLLALDLNEVLLIVGLVYLLIRAHRVCGAVHIVLLSV